MKYTFSGLCSVWQFQIHSKCLNFHVTAQSVSGVSLQSALVASARCRGGGGEGPAGHQTLRCFDPAPPSRPHPKPAPFVWGSLFRASARLAPSALLGHRLSVTFRGLRGPRGAAETGTYSPLLACIPPTRGVCLATVPCAGGRRAVRHVRAPLRPPPAGVSTTRERVYRVGRCQGCGRSRVQWASAGLGAICSAPGAPGLLPHRLPCHSPRAYRSLGRFLRPRMCWEPEERKSDRLSPCPGVAYSLTQGSPSPGLWTRTGPWPDRNGAARQEVSGGPASWYLQPLPSAGVTSSAPPQVIRH